MMWPVHRLILVGRNSRCADSAERSDNGSAAGIALVKFITTMHLHAYSTVNALHLLLGTGEEVILSSSHSDVACVVPIHSTTWGRIKAIYR